MHAHLAAYYLARQVPGQPTDAADRPIEQQLQTARNQLRDAANLLNANINNVPSTDLARGYYAAALRHTLALATDEPVLDQARLQQIAKGALLESADFQSSISAMAAMKEELLDRLDLSPRIGDCQLRYEVQSIRVPTASESTFDRWGKSFTQLYTSWGRYLKDCICSAFNPPCTPCEDPAVLLACLEVKDCEVIEICNLKRKFVLSATAWRYWLPPLSWVGEALEKLCCPDAICEEEDPADSKPGTVILGPRGSSIKATLPARINFSILQFLCGSLKKGAIISKLPPQGVGVTTRPFGIRQTLSDTLRTIGADVLRLTGISTIAFRQPVADFSTNIKDLFAAMKSEDFSKLVADALKTDPGRVGKVLEELAAEKVAAAVDKLKTKAAKELKDMKKIKTENAALKKLINEQADRAKELTDRVNKLEKGTAS